MLGSITTRLDEKGRLVLPARIRQEMAGGLIFTRGQDNSLFMFTPEQFGDFSERMRQVAFESMTPRDYDLMLFSGVDEQRPDKQWRVTISPKLRRYAGLDRDITLVGMPTRIVIWDAVRLEEAESRLESVYSQLAGEVR